MPPPGATRAARLTVELRDLIWDAAYAPLAAFIEEGHEFELAL